VAGQGRSLKNDFFVWNPVLTLPADPRDAGCIDTRRNGVTFNNENLQQQGLNNGSCEGLLCQVFLGISGRSF
jgi:hypothetical protein